MSTLSTPLMSQTADARTLLVLNDALNRYKTEGGGTSGMTYGAQIGGIFSKMRAVITYGGRGHQVMQSATTYPARSIAATGSGARYHFTRFNTYSLSDYASGDESGNGGGGTHGVQSYTIAGSYTWTVPPGVTTVEVLVVAGGGGSAQGGGGAGGLVHNAAYSVTPGQGISVTVGAGQIADTIGNAGDSIFGSIDATGGGAGGSSDFNDNGYGGGSGGGGDAGGGAHGGSGVDGQGNDGGTGWDYGAGGGGAGAPGQDGNGSDGNGGVGLQFNITGTPTYYAGGGGGGSGGTQGQGDIGAGGTDWGAGNDGCVIIKY